MLQVGRARRGAAALARPAAGRHCRSPTPCWPRPLPDCLPPASVARRVAAILQHSPVREWWGARLARLTLVLFWRLVPLAFCVYLGDVDAGVVDLERELEPRASASAANATSMDAKRAASSPAPTPASRSSSSSSSSVSSAASPSASSASSNSSPATASSPRTPCATPASSPNASKDSRVEPLEPSEAAKQSQTRESLDASRRQSFSTMAADSRATMRRRSYDFTHGALAHMPHGPPSPVGISGVSAALRSMGVDHKGHLQHLRVYGRTNLPAAAVTASPTLAPSVATTAALPSLPARENDVQGEELVDVVLPTSETVWTRGKPVTIEWKVLDANVAALAIELLEDGSSATTVIARAAPNTGAFTYHRVPWGMASGSKYFLRVSAAGDPARFATTGFFAISSAP